MKKSKGITLIALVVTIVVLLILAAVSINTLTGENGILTQAQNSKEETEQAKCEELVNVAVNSLIAENFEDKSKITPQDVAEEVNKMENRTDVTAEGNTFPTNIIFPKEDRKVNVNIELGVTEVEDDIYSVPGAEDNIAPEDIFLYEIISDASIGSTEISSLPTKEVRIIGIDPKYCNKGGYDPDTGLKEYEDTNYEIILGDGTKLTDTLVVPYQKEIDGEIYKITEVDLSVYWWDETFGRVKTGYSMPKVKTIIFPNTVKKISNKGYASRDDMIENIILPENLITLGNNAFFGCDSLTNIIIPDNVTSIGNSAFNGCTGLTNLTIPSSVTSIGNYAFYYSGIKEITIPKSVTNIGNAAFSSCDSLTTVNYRGTKEEWNKISIGSENTYLTNATINFNYTGE